MRGDDSGSALVEFGFVAPVFFLLLLVVIEFGRALFDYDAVANAARLGTRFAIVRGATCDDPPGSCTASASDVAAYVKSKSSGVDVSKMNVTTTWSPTSVCFLNPTAPGSEYYPLGNGPGCTVTVNVTYAFKFISIISTPITMSSTSTMAISR